MPETISAVQFCNDLEGDDIIARLQQMLQIYHMEPLNFKSITLDQTIGGHSPNNNSSNNDPELKYFAMGAYSGNNLLGRGVAYSQSEAMRLVRSLVKLSVTTSCYS